MDEKHVLVVPGYYANIKQICRFIAQGAAAVGLTEKVVFHIELACDEACTNIIEHAYAAEGAGEITACWEVVDDAFVITIRDNGRRFDPDHIPAPPLAEASSPPDDIDLVRIGGLGIHFMRKLMDEVTFSFDPQKGNTLVMKKRIIRE